MWKTAIILCGFYTRHVHLIALLLSAAFAAYFAVTGDPGTISFDLFVLFYGGLAGYSVAGCLMVPVFLFQKIAGVESAPNEVISMMEGVLFRSHKKADAKRCASRPPDLQANSSCGSQWCLDRALRKLAAYRRLDHIDLADGGCDPGRDRGLGEWGVADHRA